MQSWNSLTTIRKEIDMLTRTIEEATRANDGGGTIAYHSILFNENGGTSLVQYDFGGSILSKNTYSLPPVPREYSMWDKFWMAS